MVLSGCFIPQIIAWITNLKAFSDWIGSLSNLNIKRKNFPTNFSRNKKKAFLISGKSSKFVFIISKVGIKIKLKINEISSTSRSILGKSNI
mmetsp:Transcript_27939/g.68167  ORF Transcript_27939/g.68167 Transcript_27939/m.68167 type:complete len:91 (+) Transcript_27939:82-354(+)